MVWSCDTQKSCFKVGSQECEELGDQVVRRLKAVFKSSNWIKYFHIFDLLMDD